MLLSAFRNGEYRADLGFRLVAFTGATGWKKPETGGNRTWQCLRRRAQQNFETQAAGRLPGKQTEGGQPEMSGFGTDADLMDKASGQVEEVRANVENAVQQLQGNIEPVMASWRGGASDVFRKLMDQFQENAKTINQKLGEISENIKSSGQDYAQREEEQAAEMSKIEGMLGG
ncbi:hypothetical protein GCM10027563_36030 [Parasphingorhabdus pacifica]